MFSFSEIMYKNLIIIITILILPWITLSAFAVHITETNMQEMRKYTEDEVSELRKRAEAGEREAQTELSICYGQGNGITQNYKEAFKWAMRAAERGNSKAEMIVGMCYLTGKGTTIDTEEATKWLIQAAEHGNISACLKLGMLYLTGYEGTAKKPAEAIKWLRKAADQNNAEAQVMLGIMYEYGEEGVAQNIEDAKEMYMKSAAQGNAQASCMLGKYILQHQNEPWYTEKGKLAVNMIEHAAYKNDNTARELLGSMYYWGAMGKKEDRTEASKWFENGSSFSKFLLAMMYWNGDGVKQDRSKALELMSEAAKESPLAQRILDNMIISYCYSSNEK